MRVRESRLLDRSLRVPVLARDLEWGSIVGAEHRQLHQPANARAHGGVDDIALLFRLSAALAREQEHAVDSGQRGLDGFGAIEVADDVVDGVAEPGARGPWIADERPRPLTGGGQPPEHLTPIVPVAPVTRIMPTDLWWSCVMTRR